MPGLIVVARQYQFPTLEPDFWLAAETETSRRNWLLSRRTLALAIPRCAIYRATIFCRVASYRQFNRAPSGRLDHFHSDEIWRRDRELAAYILAFSRRYVVLITYLTR